MSVTAKQLEIIAHRWAMGKAPENTLLAFEYAIKAGADMIEMDVWKCWSWEIVVFHDRNTYRLTWYSYDIREQDLETLESLNVKKIWKIPTLVKALEYINEVCKVNIEIKDPLAALETLDIVEFFVNQKNFDITSFLISSFDYNILRKIYLKNNQVRLWAIMDTKDTNQINNLLNDINLYSVHIDYKIVTQEIVDLFKSKNLKVYVWSVTYRYQKKKMEKFDVDWIFTNYP